MLYYIILYYIILYYYIFLLLILYYIILNYIVLYYIICSRFPVEPPWYGTPGTPTKSTICMLLLHLSRRVRFACYLSHNLRLAPYLQQFKTIFYLYRYGLRPSHNVLYPHASFSTWYTYIQAIAYLFTIHQLPMIDVLPVLYPHIEPI